MLEQRISPADTSRQTNAANISNYRIRPQDVLQITNIQNSKNIVDLNAGIVSAPVTAAATQSGEFYTVEEDGTVALTGLGRIPVAGLTRVAARTYIEDLYHKGPLKNPLLELKIMSLKVTILGEIRTQGNILLTKDKTTLIEIIGQAGGLTEKADEKTIKIIHADQQYPKTDIINLSSIKSINDPRTILQNNDIIVIAQNKRAVRADRLQDFTTMAQPALLIFNTALILFTLIHR
ncbi:polysaccharide biosynthesis/export family protein [Mucilaginibacter sp.]|uniref:polysaccharide biosynthesis/export family protein n=1 Tax=Mucilaginibacter sp. TaxID=1882438 RepID=UPI00262068EB|nr:polysaccharide biosynthesis/export family protein [Mucilaginibacter sp.]